MRREVLTLKGNSPEYLLRSVNKEMLSMQRFYFLEEISYNDNHERKYELVLAAGLHRKDRV